jgi:hypothetical protein
MKQKIFALTLVLAVIAILPTQAQKVLKQVMALQMPEGGGSNSAAVAWNPITKKYYSSMAGNMSYPMGVFNEKGKIIQEDVEAEYDFRGIWYNAVSKQLQFNTFDSAGVGHILLDKDGKITSKITDAEGMNQPDNQSVGFYSLQGNNILYLSTAYTIEKYDSKTFKALGKLTSLHAGCKTKKESDDLTEEAAMTSWEDRNTSAQYTGIAKGEIAILNITNRTIELYDKKTGLLTSVAFSIPISISLTADFNFSYTNGMWWFFQKDDRKWVGCK